MHHGFCYIFDALNCIINLTLSSDNPIAVASASEDDCKSDMRVNLKSFTNNLSM